MKIKFKMLGRQEPEPEPPKAIPCPKCSGNMTQRIVTVLGSPLRVHDVGFTSGSSTPVSAIACQSCGYLELYAPMASQEEVRNE